VFRWLEAEANGKRAGVKGSSAGYRKLLWYLYTLRCARTSSLQRLHCYWGTLWIFFVHETQNKLESLESYARCIQHCYELFLTPFVLLLPQNFAEIAFDHCLRHRLIVAPTMLFYSYFKTLVGKEVNTIHWFFFEWEKFAFLFSVCYWVVFWIVMKNQASKRVLWLSLLVIKSCIALSSGYCGAEKWPEHNGHAALSGSVLEHQAE